MKQGPLGIAVGVAVGATLVTSISCSRLTKKSGSPSGATSKAAAQSPQDVARPFTLQIAQGSVAAPQAAMPAGSQLTLDPGSGAEPAQFAAATDATPASTSIEVAGTDGAGQPLTKAATPMTVAIELSGSSGLADSSNPGLCIFGLGKDSVFRVWRRALLTYDQSTHRVSFPTVWMGHYQAYECGTASVPGAVEVNSTGTDTIVPPGPAGSTFGTCDLTQVAGVGQCWSYVGKLYAQAGELDAYRQACTGLKGTFGTAACPASGLLGACVYNDGTTAEYAYSYYTANASAAATAGVLQIACEKTSGNQWFAPGKYTPTAGDAQKDIGTVKP